MVLNRTMDGASATAVVLVIQFSMSAIPAFQCYVLIVDNIDETAFRLL
jgi:hypothetical protein